MPRYARFDHTASQPARVTGWYDTDALKYKKLPDEADLLPVSADQWAARLANPGGWAVQGVSLVPRTVPAAPAAPPAQQAAQQAAGALAHYIGLGITVTCQSNPTAAGTYPLTAAALSVIGVAARDFAADLGLPSGGEKFPVPDMSGKAHLLSGMLVVALYRASRDLVHALSVQASVEQGGGKANWPAQTAAI